MKPRAVVFDAYGTLFDVHSVVLHAGDGIGDNLHSLATLWRQKQLEFTWLRALMGRYEDFWNVTEAALRSAVRQLKIQASEARVDSLMQAYLIPSAFPDVRRALEHLKGFPLAILSNGTPKMFINIGSVLALAGIRRRGLWRHQSLRTLLEPGSSGRARAQRRLCPGRAARCNADGDLGALGQGCKQPPGVMEVDELVDAALVGFDRCENVTIPPLPNADQWTVFDAARTAMLPNFSQVHAASRYRPRAA